MVAHALDAGQDRLRGRTAFGKVPQALGAVLLHPHHREAAPGRRRRRVVALGRRRHGRDGTAREVVPRDRRVARLDPREEEAAPVR